MAESKLPPLPLTSQGARELALQKMRECICQDRNAEYGAPENNFADIATLVNVVLRRKLKTPLDAIDVGLFCACLKLGRTVTSPRKLDHYIDLGGYAGCVAGILLLEEQEQNTKGNDGNTGKPVAYPVP